MSLFTVLGATGFIGRHLAEYLRGQGHSVYLPERDCPHLRGKPLGHVIYCIGTTGNFRQNPQAAVDAHVNKLYSLMEGAEFDSWLYLSSTRVYGGLHATARANEETPLPLLPSSDKIYDLTKLLGEAICLGKECATIRVARLSNVYGVGQSPSTFLGAIQQDLARAGSVIIGESPLSQKDYLSIKDAVFFLSQIALNGKERLYNVASGQSVSHEQLAAALRKCGKSVEFSKEGALRRFPEVDIARLSAEFGCPQQNILQEIPEILSGFPSRELRME